MEASPKADAAAPPAEKKEKKEKREKKEKQEKVSVSSNPAVLTLSGESSDLAWAGQENHIFACSEGLSRS